MLPRIKKRPNPAGYYLPSSIEWLLSRVRGDERERLLALAKLQDSQEAGWLAILGELTEAGPLTRFGLPLEFHRAIKSAWQGFDNIHARNAARLLWDLDPVASAG